MRLLLLLIVGLATGAEAACPVPKADLRVAEALIQTNRVADATNIIMAYPSDVAGQVCCTRSIYDRHAWQDILDAQIPRGTVSVLEFVSSINTPGSAVALTDAERAICQAMADRMLPPGPRVVRNTLRADGSRPLKVLRDPALPYSASNLLIDLKVAGVLQYVEAGQPCERTPVVNTTTAGQWLYVRSLSGQRGVALCK